MGVATSPGQMAQARMPWRRSLTLIDSVKETSAAFAAPYAGPEMAPGRSAAIEETFTIVPRRRARIPLSSARVIRNGAVALI